jgi:phosphoribosylcarboxyaminoimidazole (NCAIR) mutase
MSRGALSFRAFMGHPRVGVIMGSSSDWETMRHAAETLERFHVPHEVKVVSAHRTPEERRICRGWSRR